MLLGRKAEDDRVSRRYKVWVQVEEIDEDLDVYEKVYDEEVGETSHRVVAEVIAEYLLTRGRDLFEKEVQSIPREENEDDEL